MGENWNITYLWLSYISVVFLTSPARQIGWQIRGVYIGGVCLSVLDDSVLQEFVLIRVSLICSEASWSCPAAVNGDVIPSIGRVECRVTAVIVHLESFPFRPVTCLHSTPLHSTSARCEPSYIVYIIFVLDLLIVFCLCIYSCFCTNMLFELWLLNWFDCIVLRQLVCLAV